MSARQSTRQARKQITEMDDGTLSIFFPEENRLVLIRWVIELGKRTMQVAAIQDVDRPLETAKIL